METSREDRVGKPCLWKHGGHRTAEFSSRLCNWDRLGSVADLRLSAPSVIDEVAELLRELFLPCSRRVGSDLGRDGQEAVRILLRIALDQSLSCCAVAILVPHRGCLP